MSQTQPIFTDRAAAKVNELIKGDSNPDLKLRVYISGGGCSGFQYGFMFEKQKAEDDLVIEKIVEEEDDEGGDGGGQSIVQVLVDPMSLQYLIGAEIDYKSDAGGEHFVVRNPNVKTTCGCGSSFAVE